MTFTQFRHERARRNHQNIHWAAKLLTPTRESGWYSWVVYRICLWR